MGRISGFHRRCYESVLLWQTGGSTIVCVRLEGDSPMVEEFELPLLAAGRDIWRGTSLMTTA